MEEHEPKSEEEFLEAFGHKVGSEGLSYSVLHYFGKQPEGLAAASPSLAAAWKFAYEHLTFLETASSEIPAIREIFEIKDIDTAVMEYDCPVSDASCKTHWQAAASAMRVIESTLQDYYG